MQKYVHPISYLGELFEKIKFGNEKYGATYTAVMFKTKDPNTLIEFQEFLLKYLRISDTVFSYSKTKVLVILEETTLRGALVLNDRLRAKIKEKGFNYDYYCSAIQGDYIETSQKLTKGLKKRLKIAREQDTSDCIHSLSSAN